jgi:hypothetical protein
MSLVTSAETRHARAAADENSKGVVEDSRVSDEYGRRFAYLSLIALVGAKQKGAEPTIDNV